MEYDLRLKFILVICHVGTSEGGHESSPPAAAELWVLGAEGAARHRRLWERHAMAKQGTRRTILTRSNTGVIIRVIIFGAVCGAVISDRMEKHEDV